jgi:riboflavin kinase / FMN adenylyltransferase
LKTYISSDQRPDTDTVIAIGSFDGVHLGHQALLAQLKAKGKKQKVPTVVYTFDPPARVLMQGVEFLSTLPEKLSLLASFGIDETIAASFNAEFAARPKEAFLNDLLALKPRCIVVGEDFHFGKGRKGTVADLKTVAPEVVVVPIYQLSGEDIKSSRIRQYLKFGDVANASKLLGRYYDAHGVVVQGDLIGRTLGYPTANIRVPEGKALPMGVFAVVVSVKQGTDDIRLCGMANVGFRPTVNGTGRRFEVHLFDFQGDLYGKELDVKFYHYLRKEKKFGNLDELKLQLAHDSQQARELLKNAL